MPDVSQLTFSHANGKVDAKTVKKINRSGRRSKFPAARCHASMRATIARMDDLRYPVGKFSVDPTVTPDKRRTWIRQIKETPAAMRQAIGGLSEHQLDTPYRPAGWTVRQVAHHVPDSHMNAYIRCKLALTEDNPTIRPYNETEWAKVADTARTPVEVSLTLLESFTPGGGSCSTRSLIRTSPGRCTIRNVAP